MNTRAFGIVSALVGASLWGFSGTCVQFLTQNYAISTLFIAMARMLGAGALFLIIILTRHRGAFREIAHDKQARRRFLLFGAIGMFFCQLTYIIVIGYTNAGTGTVLQSLSIVIIMVATCVIARRWPRITELIGLVLAFTATLVIATQGDLKTLQLPIAGLLWGLASAASAAVYSMVPQPLYDKWSSSVVVGSAMLIGGCVATVTWGLAFAFPDIDAFVSAGNACGTSLLPILDAQGIGALVITAFFGTFAAFYLYLHGISIVGAVQGSQLGAIEPVSATVCSALLTGTAFSVPDWIGLGLMVSTILLVAARQ